MKEPKNHEHHLENDSGNVPNFIKSQIYKRDLLHNLYN